MSINPKLAAGEKPRDSIKLCICRKQNWDEEKDRPAKRKFEKDSVSALKLGKEITYVES